MTANEPAAFIYPHGRDSRRHGPSGYADYRSYRPWLRDEYSFRCAYCLVRERWGQVTGQFDLDHFLSKVANPDAAVEYDNLFYACHACNLRKGDQVLPGVALTADVVRVYNDGQMIGLTPDAERLIRNLWLNTPQSVEWRRLWIRVVQLAKEHDVELYRQLMGYPDKLPDLSSLHPPSNVKPQGVDQSCRARRDRGELSELYLY